MLVHISAVESSTCQVNINEIVEHVHPLCNI